MTRCGFRRAYGADGGVVGGWVCLLENSFWLVHVLGDGDEEALVAELGSALGGFEVFGGRLRDAGHEESREAVGEGEEGLVGGVEGADVFGEAVKGGSEDGFEFFGGAGGLFAAVAFDERAQVAGDGGEALGVGGLMEPLGAVGGETEFDALGRLCGRLFAGWGHTGIRPARCLACAVHLWYSQEMG